MFLFRIVFGLTLGVASLQAAAQADPAKPVRMVLAWPFGGGADSMARALGQQAVVDNRGGSNSIIGADMERLGKLVRAAGVTLQ